MKKRSCLRKRCERADKLCGNHFRASGAEKAIASITSAFPDMMVGAGTVTNMEEAEKAVKAGANSL